VCRQSPEYLCSIVHVVLVSYFVGVEGDERGIQDESGPLARYKEQGREECVSDVFRQDKLVEFVAEVYRVNVVAFQV